MAIPLWYHVYAGISSLYQLLQIITYIKYLMMFFYQLGFTDFQFLIFHFYFKLFLLVDKKFNTLIHYFTYLYLYFLTNFNLFQIKKTIWYLICCQHFQSLFLQASKQYMVNERFDQYFPVSPHFFGRILCTHRDHHLSAKGVL